jgi:gamma-glutamyltranspeptidase/glutathione hydrolase
MSPTLLLNGGQPFLVTGSPGGSTIITTVVQSIVSIVDVGMNVQQAVDAPRFHHQWLPDVITIEPGYLTSPSQTACERMRDKIRTASEWGADDSILVDREKGLVDRANDRRRPAGLADGY